MPDIQIDNLQIRLRGVSPQVAQAAVAQLQEALQAALSQRGGCPESTETLDLGTVRLNTQPTAGALSSALAGRIAAQLAPAAKIT